MATITWGGPSVVPQKLENDPTLPGFIAWVYAFMGVPESVLAPDSAFLEMAYDTSINVVYDRLKLVPNRSRRRYRRPPEPRPDPPHPAHPIVEPPHPAHPIVDVPVPGAPILGPSSPSIYALCVYNLGGHVLVNTAWDLTDPPAQPPPDNAATYWADLRRKFSLNTMSLGIITSASDQGTSAGQQIPDMIKNMSLFNMWLLQTPWGRMYMMLAGQWGTIWDIS